MKSNITTPSSPLPRRRLLLGTVMATSAVLAGGEVLTTSGKHARGGLPAQQEADGQAAPRPKLVVRPAPDAVKRHG